jgi:thiamine-monophosphate kinase
VTPLSALGEFGLIDRLRETLGEAATHPDVLVSIGDDAAAYRVSDDRAHVVTTDALVEGVHFDRAFTPLERLGFKAISVNVSDVCAMNARPLVATVALGLPAGMAVEDVESLYTGMRRACERYGCALVGGDVTAARSLLVSVTVVGQTRPEALTLRRTAQIGDIVCVTGDVGAAFAGLKLLLDARDRLRDDETFQPDFADFQYVLARQLAPTARLDAVEAFDRAGVRPSAMIDVSDGLASEVHHLARQSGVGFRLYEAALPLDNETRAVADRFEAEAPVLALFGGEDYELLFTMPEADLVKLPAQGLFTPIGRVTPPGEGVLVQTAEGDEIALEAGGFDHFGRP